MDHLSTHNLESSLVYILDLVRSADPVGLIEGGAPGDEYDQEAHEIFLKKKRGELSATNAYDEVRKIFLRSFGDDTPIYEDRLRLLGEELMKL